ncbi:MAG: alpha/beta fold hydrolase [Myxococcales bacterium]
MTQPIRQLNTASQVRMRLWAENDAADLDWLFLPGGPGIGSESLIELVDAVQVPGRAWLVDLPGDGSNLVEVDDPYAAWPQVLLEAARAVPHPVYVGHSTGGMYLLSVPELEQHIQGLVLVSSAPDAAWMAAMGEMVQAHELPAFNEANARYDADPTPERLREVCVASAPWNFGADHLEIGAALLGRMPYNPRAVAWSAKNFDSTYAHTWWPKKIPTLIVSGTDDRIVTQALWNDPAFEGAHVLHRRIAGGAHFAWIENPVAVRDAFAELAERIAERK